MKIYILTNDEYYPFAVAEEIGNNSLNGIH